MTLTLLLLLLLPPLAPVLLLLQCCCCRLIVPYIGTALQSVHWPQSGKAGSNGLNPCIGYQPPDGVGVELEHQATQ